MKAFITGVGGFVGPHLVRHLLGNGFEVCGVDRNGVDVLGCAVFQCDITNPEELASIVKKVKPDFVFHLAGQSSVEKSWKEPELTWKINVMGTKSLLDAIVAAKLSPKILLVSSAEVYGIPKSVPITESHPLQPVSPYGKSKVEQEKLALAYKQLHIIICRSFPHIGPGQPPTFVCSNFAEQVVNVEKGKSDSIHVGNLDAKRDFTDVRDVVRAYLLALQKCGSGSIFNVCSGSSHSIGSVLDLLVSLSTAKKPVKIVKDESRLRKSDIPQLLGSPVKFMSATGWSSSILFERTLADLLEYWRKSGKRV